MLHPVYKGTWERFVPGSTDDPIWVRDGTIEDSKDLGRSLDYLETRNDIDMQKVAYLGQSWGSEVAPIPLASESRVRMAVLLSHGVDVRGPAGDQCGQLARSRQDSHSDGERRI
jgi:hypothetical protein